VQFFAGHQATVWWRRVAQEHAGLTTARTLDSYPWAGTINAGNLPLVLAHARRQGMLQDGTLVAMFQAGTGATYAASIYRW
jgi:3-oxoacyl-[acyl-carrier-protein] synthase III